MELRISATELARTLGDVLARVRYRGDTFVVERNGVPVARVSPAFEQAATSLGELVQAWRDAGPADPGFARVLSEIGALDTEPLSPWDS